MSQDPADDSDAPEDFRAIPQEKFLKALSLPCWQEELKGSSEVAVDASLAPSSPHIEPPAATDSTDGFMDPLAQEAESDSDDESPDDNAGANSKALPKFPINTELNGLITLWYVCWKASLLLIVNNVIVSEVNDSNEPGALSLPILKERRYHPGVAGKILEAAGPELLRELNEQTTEQCKTGESRVTKAYQLPASWLIHTVGPRYNEKYITAAENALHNCYRSCLETALEQRAKTISFPVVHSTRRGYPVDTGAHIAIRTIRRFLEKWGKENFARILLAIDNDEVYSIYSKILPLYFPRNSEELNESLIKLPKDTGNEFGETVVQERKVRIGAFPTMQSPSFESTISGDNGMYESVAALAAMQSDKDDERRRRLAIPVSDEQRQQQRLYMQYLHLAHKTDLSDVHAMNLFYQSGTDAFGRPIMVFVAMKLPEDNEILLDKIFLYVIKVMDVIANGDYIVVYLHSLMSSKSKPDFSWLRKVYNIMDSKYGERLQAFYVLHPTFWLKLAEGVVSALSSSTVFSKIQYVDMLHELFQLVGSEQLKVPEEVHRYDEQINGKSHISAAVARGNARGDGL